MKLKISQKDKNMLVVLVGILLIFVSYNFGYRPLKEKTEVLKRQNKAIEKEMTTLQNISKAEGQYLLETQEMQKNMDELIQKFPTNMISEDIILYVRNMEQKTNSYVQSFSISPKKYVTIDATIEEDVLSSFDDVTGTISENGYVNDGSIPDTGNMRLGQIVSDIRCSVTYSGLKKMVKDIVEGENRKNIDDISLVFNENTGDLSGRMTITYFTLSGTGKEYNKPTVTGTIHGVDCIFGGLKSSDTVEE